MKRQELYKKISIENPNKMVMIILDGLGGLPLKGKTELEAARTPNLDHLATISELGLTHPISPGITPGSGPAHLSLFGYDPLDYPIGRGILEALGIGIDVKANDIAVRGNFATQENGNIIDRRAGRISTEQNRKIISHLAKRIHRIEDVKVMLYAGREHRFVAIFQGSGLDDQITDADPEATGVPILFSRAKSAAAERTSNIINKFMVQVMEELKNQKPANACLLRGAARYPDIPSMKELFKLETACIATYPMYKGLARLVGMDILDAGTTLQDQVRSLEEHFHRYEFFFIHIKKTDSHGEDGNFNKKVKIIEEFDSNLKSILKLNPSTLVITGDHSTPSVMKSHSWHPNPFLIHSPYLRLDNQKNIQFNENQCARGILGRFYSIDILPLMMAHALKFKKYGA